MRSGLASWSSPSPSPTSSFAAYNGDGAWIGRPFRALRSVVSLYPELVTVIVRANSHIHDLSDLAGGRVNVGSRGSGTRATWDAIEEEVGWSAGRRMQPVALRGAAATSALCNGAIDASLMIVGHPSPLVTGQQAACAVNFVAINGRVVDKLVHDHPFTKLEPLVAPPMELPLRCRRSGCARRW